MTSSKKAQIKAVKIIARLNPEQLLSKEVYVRGKTCFATSTDSKQWFCTRPIGHDGPHTAIGYGPTHELFCQPWFSK